MTPDVSARSFEPARDRPVPLTMTGHTLDGEPIEFRIDRVTLIVAIKPSCDGCRDFVHSDLDELSEVSVVVVSATGDAHDEWTGAVRPVIVAPQILSDLDVRWPPFYVLIDPGTGRVITEGVVFTPAQVAQEIAPFLA